MGSLQESRPRHRLSAHTPTRAVSRLVLFALTEFETSTMLFSCAFVLAWVGIEGRIDSEVVLEFVEVGGCRASSSASMEGTVVESRRTVGQRQISKARSERWSLRGAKERNQTDSPMTL